MMSFPQKPHAMLCGFCKCDLTLPSFKCSGWWAVPFTDASRRLSMHQVLGHLQGPLLAVIGANDELITKDGIQVGRVWNIFAECRA